MAARPATNRAHQQQKAAAEARKMASHQPQILNRGTAVANKGRDHTVLLESEREGLFDFILIHPVPGQVVRLEIF